MEINPTQISKNPEYLNIRHSHFVFGKSKLNPIAKKIRITHCQSYNEFKRYFSWILKHCKIIWHNLKIPEETAEEFYNDYASSVKDKYDFNFDLCRSTKALLKFILKK